MTFDEVGALARLSGGPSANNIPVVHTLLMPIQYTFDLEPRSLWKGMRRTGELQRSSSSKNRPNRPSSSSIRAIIMKRYFLYSLIKLPVFARRIFSALGPSTSVDPFFSRCLVLN